MSCREVSPRFFRASGCMVVVGAIVASMVGVGPVAAEEQPEQVKTAYAITIDPTSLVPQSWWQVPGVTPSIWTSDAETSDAYRTTTARELRLMPGLYKFVSFTFDFPFEVTLQGTVQYKPTLDQCVEGRGTPRLIIRCKRTYPHGGQPEYSLAPEK